MDSKKIAVVSGANRGIGFEICGQLAGRGLKVVLTARDSAKGKAACEKLQTQGLDVIFHQLDPTDPGSIKHLARFLGKDFGKLDVLVNNAGILLPEDNTAADLDPEILRKTLETNVVAAFALSQALIPLMRKRGGKIINVSSHLGALGAMDGGWPAYRISKAALNAVTRVLASELAADKIQVNSMTPGWVRTDMGGSNAPVSVEEGADTVTWLATLPDNGPTGGFYDKRKPTSW
jgi:NAD(P)-dependent dehydrogenase (short-subunit alcohol dehydrogenase family)